MTALVDGQRARQAHLGERPRLTGIDGAGVQQCTRAKAGRRLLGSARVAAGQPPVGDSSQKPFDHASHPAAESPRLCSTNEKSVRTWESNTRLKTP